MQPFAKYDEEVIRAEEAQLRATLQRVAAPEGFADRLMARVEAEPRKAKLLLFRSPVMRTWMGGAIAAALALGVFAAGEVHERRERRAAEAQRQFALASRATDHALEQARTQLARAGISLE